MLGLFNTLNLGARSLQAQQLGVEVTGQNLANANNPAYARQRVQIQTSLPTPTSLGQQGTGAQVTSIQQIRDFLLDGEIRDESSVGGYWASQQDALHNAQTELGQFLNLNGAAGTAASGSGTAAQSLSDQLNQLFNAFQGVAADPTSFAQRQNLVSQAMALTAGFNQVFNRLSALSGDLDTSVSNGVASANQLLSDIASLNGEIANATAAGGNANDLYDTRQEDLEKLAKLTDIRTTANADGTTDVSIGGTQLIAGNQVLDTLQSYDAGGGRLLVRTAASATPLTLAGGSIQGTIDARDGTLLTLRSGLDSIASSLVTEVNNIYQPGVDLNGDSGALFFTGADAATIGVNVSLQTDPSQVQAAAAAGTPGDNSIALALAALGRQSLAALGNQNFGGAYATDVGAFGFALSNANNQVANHNAVNSMLLNQRDSVSGVSIEEETANLITYQKAYQASAKIISTVDEMLQVVINLKR